MRRRGLRGFLIVEMVGYVAILSGVLLVVGDVAATSFSLMRETREREAAITDVDAVMDLLRRDVWNASAIHAAPDALVLTTAEGTVNWKYDGGTLTRSAVGPTRQWKNVSELTFADGAASVVVAVGKEHLTLPSQRLMGAEGRP
jgi:hypothetical protein